MIRIKNKIITNRHHRLLLLRGINKYRNKNKNNKNQKASIFIPTTTMSPPSSASTTSTTRASVSDVNPPPPPPSLSALRSPIRDVTSIENWPPRCKKSSTYDWEKPTNEAYMYNESNKFTTSFNEARSKLDYSYHLNPKIDRQHFQDSVLHRVINNSKTSKHNKEPWIVFTAGPMGVGKSYVLSQLYQRELFPLNEFVKIDPDMIKSELPEMAGYLQHNAETAATKLHRESTQMSDVLFEHSLQSKYHILVDGSLRDVEWFKILFNRLRTNHPEYRLAILYVSATDETIRNRAAVRAEKTGRAVPDELLTASIEQVPISVTALAPLTDETYEITNDDDMPMVLKHFTSNINKNKNNDNGDEEEEVSWEIFRQTWMDTNKDEEEETQQQQQQQKQQGDDDNNNKKDSPMTTLICKMMSSFDDPKEHEAAFSIWGNAYPTFCARCALACDGQCGICIHEQHVCACTICSTSPACRLDNNPSYQRKSTFF